MAARFLDDAARAAFQEAIEAIEQTSAAEVVVALRRESSAHLLANLIVGGACAFLGLAYMLYSTHRFSLLSILFDPFVVGLGMGALVELLPPVKRWLVPRRRRRFAVERGAKAAFYDRGVANTRGRTGVLVYLSWLEGAAVVLPDSGVPESLRAGPAGPASAIAALEARLAAAMPRGGVAVAAELRAIAATLATAMPRGSDDVNELPDTVDDQSAPRAPRSAAPGAK